MNEDGRKHVVIVGAGFGGLNAARALEDAPVRVTIVDRRNHHLFQPLLYQVATAALSPADIAHPIRAILRRQKNACVLLGEVTGIDVENRAVLLKDGELNYDYLIVAAGARASYFGRPEWEHLAPALKGLEDALEIRRRLLLCFEKAERETDEGRRNALLTFVIVGGGPTGVEVAGAVAEIAHHVMIGNFRRIDPRKSRIILVEAGPRILSTFPESLSADAEADLRLLGVEVHVGKTVRSLGAEVVEFGEERVEAGAVIWAAGVEANALGRSLGAPVDRMGRVIVQPDLTVPGHPDIFVIGDLAVFTHQTGKPLPGLAPVAIQQGRRAAGNINRAIRGEPSDPFHYIDRGTLATIGRGAAIADFGRIRISGFVAWLVWAVVHIFSLIGFQNRVLVMVQWAWAYFTDQRAARLITGNIDQIAAVQEKSGHERKIA